MKSSRILIDTNVLLNGMFVPFSYSRAVLNHVKSGRLIGYISENTIGEAYKRLYEVNRKICIDMLPQFEKLIKHFSPFILPRVSCEKVNSYKHIKGLQDKALAALAINAGLSICTNDVNDFRKSKQYGINVVTPYEVCSDGSLNLDDIFNGNLATQSEGTYYLEATSRWRDICDFSIKENYFGLFDTPGIGGFYVSSSNYSLEFKIDNGPSASVSIKNIPYGELTIKVVVTYKNTDGVLVYFGYRGPKAETKIPWVPLPLSSNPSTNIMKGRLGDFPASIYIKLLSGFHKKVTEKEANNLMGGKIPSYPWERIPLEEAILKNFS